MLVETQGWLRVCTEYSLALKLAPSMTSEPVVGGMPIIFLPKDFMLVHLLVLLALK